MLNNPYLIEMLAEEHRKDIIRELARARQSGESPARPLAIVLAVIAVALALSFGG